jgi:hypothetical protein
MGNTAVVVTRSAVSVASSLVISRQNVGVLR